MNKTHGGNIWKIAKGSGLKPEEVIDFSASINPFGLSPKAEAAIKNAISFLGSYPEPGAEAMRTELALFHNLPEENILVGNGSTEFIYLLPQVLRPKKAVMVEPSFSEHRNALESVGCVVEDFLTLENQGFVPDTERLCSEIAKGCDVAYLCNPANPTGVLLSKNDILKIAGECRRRGALLAVDEAFIDFAEDESVKREAITMDNLIVIRSMTKFFSMAGLRLGYVIAGKRLIKRLEAVKPPWSVNTMAAIAGVESLRDSNYIEKTTQWFQGEKEFLYDGLDSITGLKPYQSAANYFLVKIMQKDISAAVLHSALLRDAILIRDCSSFLGLDDRFFRVSVRKRGENELFLGALRKLLIPQYRQSSTSLRSG